MYPHYVKGETSLFLARMADAMGTSLFLVDVGKFPHYTYPPQGATA
jgi:hypothetical protein